MHRTDTDLLAELAGRGCSGRTEERFEDGFVQRRKRDGHFSIVEHASFTFSIIGISRACLAQLTRHRHASFSVESQRYSEVQSHAVVPPSMWRSSPAMVIVRRVMAETRAAYEQLVALGIPKEDARFLTVQGTTTRLLMTMNARSLIEFFDKRMDEAAQWEIRDLATKIHAIVIKEAPEIFS